MRSSGNRKIVVGLLGLLPVAALALEINTATRAQLEQLPGLGVDGVLQARAQRPFADWDDLAERIAGLRGKRAELLDRHGLTVDGKRLAAGKGK
jgi:competence protein ComEA